MKWLIYFAPVFHLLVTVGLIVGFSFIYSDYEDISKTEVHALVYSSLDIGSVVYIFTRKLSILTLVIVAMIAINVRNEYVKGFMVILMLLGIVTLLVTNILWIVFYSLTHSKLRKSISLFMLISTASILLLIWWGVVLLAILIRMAVRASVRRNYDVMDDQLFIHHEQLNLDDIHTIIYENYMKLSSKECIIWYWEYKRKDVIVALPTCYHLYHKQCISEWFKKQNICPIDRVQITQEEISKWKDVSQDELFKKINGEI